MTITEYALNIALVGLVFLQVRGRKLTVANMVMPVAVTGWVAMTFLRTIPTAGNDLVLEVGGALLGALLGTMAAVVTRVTRDSAGHAHAKAGARAAVLWVFGIGARVGFSLYAHAKARRLVGDARDLAVQGLNETRDAVHALWDDPVQLSEQMRALASRDGAQLEVNGTERKLPAAAGLALYRSAQEALTNARKHAPASPVSVELDFEPARVAVTVRNGAPATSGDKSTSSDKMTSGHKGRLGDLAATGGGYGLQGMRERVEMLGGTVDAGPSGDGFSVQVVVPV